MDVTKDNFEEVLPEVLEEIESCSFVSVDTELTGLWRNGEPSLLDSQEEYYNLFLRSASDFIIVQLGLSIFTLDPKTKKYRVKTYNFYVFPRQFSKSNSYSFSCQVGSIDFLVSNNFDFNKTFNKGISFLNIEREAELTELLEEKRFFKEKSANREIEPIEIPEEHKKCVEETCEKLSSVMKLKSAEEVWVPGLNSYIRRLIYQTIKERYPNGELIVDTRDGNMVSRKGKVDGHKPKTQLEIDEESIKKAVGLSKVMRALSKSGKLIVGHNMFLDICHIVHSFVCDSPKTYQEFKGLIKGVFPLLLDTKFISSSEGMRDLISNTTIQKLISRMSETPFSLPETELVEGYSYPDDCGKYHEAGFDSYATGVCFISMYNYLAGSKNTTGNVVFEPQSKMLAKFINRVFMNNSPDNHFFFSGSDSEPDRSHFFHASFPKDWVSKNIIHLFSPYSRVNITWINETSAWVSVCDKSQTDTVRANLCGKHVHHTGGAVISAFSPAKYRSLVTRKRPSEQGLTNYHSPHVKRRRSSHETSLTNKSSIETIPEENEEELDYQDNGTPKRSRPVVYTGSSSKNEQRVSSKKSSLCDWKKQIVNYLTPNTERQSRHGKLHKTAYASGKCDSPDSLPIRSSSSASGNSSSSSESQDSVIAELEKELDNDQDTGPFAGTTNWDIS